MNKSIAEYHGTKLDLFKLMIMVYYTLNKLTKEILIKKDTLFFNFLIFKTSFNITT